MKIPYKMDSSFRGFDIRKDRKKDKSDYVTTGSIVGNADDKTWVYEEQIDVNPHPPINEIHFQRAIRASKKGKRPKKVKSNKINEINHESIKF